MASCGAFMFNTNHGGKMQPLGSGNGCDGVINSNCVLLGFETFALGNHT